VRVRERGTEKSMPGTWENRHGGMFELGDRLLPPRRTGREAPETKGQESRGVEPVKRKRDLGVKENGTEDISSRRDTGEFSAGVGKIGR